jgi:hypothetical protein
MTKNEFKPNKKQSMFLSLPTSIKEAAYLGGAGSGKSEVLLLYPIVRKWHEHPKFKQLFLRRTFPEIRNEIWPRSEQIYTKFGAKPNKSEMVWIFPSGARIYMGHCENESDVRKYDSMEINLFTPDEITSFTEYIYLYIAFTRVRSSDRNLPAITRTAGMPGGIGHTWTKKRFVDPYKAGGKILVGKGGNKRIFIFATLKDNEDNIDPTYRQSLEALPEAEKQAKLYGNFDAFQGQVFDEFRDKHFPDEPPNALHTCKPFEIPAWWPRIFVGDWGYRASTWIGCAAISPNRRVYLYRELNYIQTRISEWAPELRYWIEKESPRIVKFCKSAGQDRGQDQTIQQQITDEIQFPIELTNNSPGSRVAGKILIHEYLRWKPKPIINTADLPPYDEEHALKLLRNRGLDEYKAYLAMFDPPKIEDNLPKLQIFLCEETDHSQHPNCCPVVIEAIKAASYDKPKNNKLAEDVAEWQGDDAYDGLRYLLDACNQFYGEAESEFTKIQQQQALLERLEQNKDYTQFYRNARALDSSQSIQPVSRYRH